MTLLEFAKLCCFDKKVVPKMRRGQTLFNLTYSRFPEIADKYRETDIDPFHDDDNIPYFLSAILIHHTAT